MLGERDCLKQGSRSKYLGILSTSDGKTECKLDQQCGISSTGLPNEQRAFDLPIYQYPNLHLGSGNLDNDQKSEVMNTNR